MLAIAIPKWKSGPVGWAAMLSVGIGLRLAASIKMSSEIGVLGALLSQHDWGSLFRRQLSYALYAIPAALSAALQKLAAAQMALSMRKNVSAALDERYGAAQSLPTAVSNAGDTVQMGTADVSTFCKEAVGLFEVLFKSSTEVILLSGKLASMMGGAQLAQCYLFFGLAGTWTRFVGPSFATLSADVAKAEGEAVKHHARVREFAEEISMMRGAAAESSVMSKASQLLFGKTSARLLQSFSSEALDTYTLRYLGILAAFTAMLPAVARAAGSASDPTEYFLTCLHLLVNVGMALKDLVLSHKLASSSRGLATRVLSLFSALENTSAAPTPSAARSADVALELSNLAIETPDGKSLLSSLSLRLHRGERLLVCGPNGSGKSSLTRVLSNVWPKAAGEITWGVAAEDVLFLPQRTYVLPNATLKQNLFYPALAPKDFPALWAISDAEILEILERVGLRSLASDSSALDEPGRCLDISPGEKQRLALARLLLRKPKVAVLDEPCASVEATFELAFFKELAEKQMTVVTVAHRAELAPLHTHVLRLDGKGGATLESSKP